jgi:hypothetical protein
MPRAVRSRALGFVLAATAGALAIAAGGCGNDGDDAKKAPVKPKPPAPHTAGRFESPQYIFTSRALPATKELTVAGKRVSGGRDYLLVVRVRLVNKKHTPLRVGQITADLRASRGRSFAPEFADGREATDPMFAETTVPASRSIDAELVYRLPLSAIAGADLRVTDPLRHQSFEQSMY